MAQSLVKNLEMLKKLSGKEVMPNVAIITTMWGEVKEETGVRREEELVRDFWSDVVDNGGRVARFRDTQDSAWNIINGGNGGNREPVQEVPFQSVQLPREILAITKTSVGAPGKKELEKMLKLHRKAAAKKLREQAKRQNSGGAFVEELNKIYKKINHTADQLRALEIPLGTKILLFLRTNRS